MTTARSGDGRVGRPSLSTITGQQALDGTQPEEYHYGATFDEVAELLDRKLVADLLPYVGNPDVPASPHSDVKASGKVPTRKNSKGQRVGIPKWPTLRSKLWHLFGWLEDPDLGLCLQTRTYRAIDVDDEVLAEAIQQCIDAYFPGLPRRWRANSNKFVVLLRIDPHQPMRKRIIKTAHGAIEFLADGQQVLIAGPHPTGARYVVDWHSDGHVKLDAFESLWKELERRFAAALAATTAKVTPTRAQKLHDAAANDPNVQKLYALGAVKSVAADGSLNVVCPFEDEHTQESTESATRYWPAHTGGYAHDHVFCFHAHCANRSRAEFFDKWGIDDLGFEDLRAIPNGDSRTPRSAAALLQREFMPVRWIVPRILPEGVFLLVAAPKIGKSWFALQIGLAVISGGEVLGERAAVGDVLYLALEDNDRRMRSRLEKHCAELLPDDELSRFEYVTDWPRVNQGGGKAIEEWLEAHPDARLVIVDVLERFRPARDPKGSLYAEDYQALQALKALSERFQVSIVVVHHTRKSTALDPMEMISGTQGLAGAADGMLMLSRPRGSSRGELFVVGRDLEDEGSFVVEFSPADCCWHMVGGSAEVARTAERQEVLDFVRRAGEPVSCMAVAVALEKNRTTVARLLTKLCDDGLLVREAKRYRVLTLTKTSNNGNNDEYE